MSNVRYRTSLRASMRSLLLVSIALACWTVVKLAAAADSYRFHPQSLQLAHALEDILVLHGKCKRRELCSNEQIFFVTSESWGLSIELYDLDDENALREVLRAVSDSFVDLPNATTVEVKVYVVSKRAALAAPVFRKPEPTMKLRWEKRNADR